MDDQENTAPQSNGDPMKELMANAREYGRLEAQGKDALPMLALKVAWASGNSVISGQKDADGDDDYVRVYAEYVAARGKKAVHEHTPGGLKANVSKLRQIGNAAAMPTADFCSSINTLISKRTEMQAAKEKVRPCYQAIVELARVQLDQPDDLSDDQIAECIKKPDPNEKTVEGELKRVEKILADMLSGEKSVTCKDPEIVAAHEQISAKLAAFTFKREVDETLAKAQALGIVVQQPTLIPADTQVEGEAEAA